MTATIQPEPTILRRKELEAKIKLGHSAIYERINPASKYYAPTFPKPILLGPGGSGKNPPVGFVESEVNAWLNAQIEKSRTGGV